MSADHVMKAVIDTNVWLDWLLFDDPSVRPLRADFEAGRMVILACRDARVELANVLARPAVLEQATRARMRRGAPARVATEARSPLEDFDRIAAIHAVADDCGLHCSDPDDQRFVDLAAAHCAHWLLTRDRALLALAPKARRRFGFQIGTPQTYGTRTALRSGA